MIQLTHDRIDSHALVRQAQTAAAGAVLLFLGVTRQQTAGRETTELTYDAYPAMAERELSSLENQARERWGLSECLIVHRLGTVPLGDASVAIVVASPHRRAAFEAGEWLIDTLKERVPIWKQEHWADGTSEWVHPTPKCDGPVIPRGVSRPEGSDMPSQQELNVNKSVSQIPPVAELLSE